MKELVTGGAGFIGSRLVVRLLADGAAVHVVDDLSLGRREHLPENEPRLVFTQLDVCSADFAALVQREKPDRVWHFAANSDISSGTRDMRTDLSRTFLTTFHVLEALKSSPADLVFASTSAIYGVSDGALGEDHGPLRPISLYGAAKLASEAYISAACNLYGFKSWIFRFPNVIGPNLTHGVIHDFVRRLGDDPTRLVVLGDGTQEKPYLHVDDLLDAMLLAVARAREPVNTFNIAGEGATRVREIAELVRAEMGLPDARIDYGSEKIGWPGDVPRFSYDTSRIRRLGWKPRLSSVEAVRAAVRDEVERCKRSS